MIREFEGKNEQEAIAKAMEELQVELDEFDIEVVEGSKRGLFKKGNVRIRVRLEDENSDYEEKIITFVETLLEKMGYPSTVKVNYRDNAKLGLEIVSDDSAITSMVVNLIWGPRLWSIAKTTASQGTPSRPKWP
jgi:spoIIIJ-associated protein